jgi:putative transposase
VILLWVWWYLAYNLSLRNLEEMKAERGISVDHTASKQFLRKVLKRHGRPKRIVIDVS